MGEEVIIIPVIFLSLVAIIKTLSDNRLRKEIIQRGEVDPALVSSIMGRRHVEQSLTSVKWAFVLISIGLAFILIGFIPDGGFDPNFNNDTDTLKMGILIICAGAGFAGYYLFASKKLTGSESNI